MRQTCWTTSRVRRRSLKAQRYVASWLTCSCSCHQCPGPGMQDEDEEIPLEPFNLRREREEGTFSADGHYEEKRNEKKQPVGKFNEKGEYVIVKDEDEDEEADAWIDSLQVWLQHERVPGGLQQPAVMCRKSRSTRTSRASCRSKLQARRLHTRTTSWTTRTRWCTSAG
jgi:hypothetical protein